MQSTNPKNEERRLKINDNQWCYTSTKSGARKKVKRHRNTSIRQHYKNELREYLMKSL